MNPTLRPPHPEQYRTVCSWAIAEQWPGLVKGSLLSYDEFPQILGLPGHLSFELGEEGSPAIGFGQVWVATIGTVNLVRILIDPALRGKGLGKQLSSLLLAEALRLPNVQQVKLRVRRDNLPAVAVYRSIGFRELASESNANVMAMAYEA